MSHLEDYVVNLDAIEEVDTRSGEHWGGFDKRLTPAMRSLGGKLGVNHVRLPPGRVGCPFHYHQHEDEVFFVVSGRGVLRYGDELRPLRVGDCVVCPAGTQVAHQIANPFDEDLVYLAIGPHEPHEVCGYPDSGKLMLRGLRRLGFMSGAASHEGEPEPPKIFELAGPHR